MQLGHRTGSNEEHGEKENPTRLTKRLAQQQGAGLRTSPEGRVWLPPLPGGNKRRHTFIHKTQHPEKESNIFYFIKIDLKTDCVK